MTSFSPDIDECDSNDDVCKENEECKNIAGSNECPCKDGYERQSGNCVGRHTYPLDVLM